MYMKFERISHGDRWEGWNWKIIDEDRLAELIAQIAVGQWLVVKNIINGITNKIIEPSGGLAGAKTKLIAGVVIDDDGKKKVNFYNRDGWLFQAISWIAAHYLINSNGEILPPHPRIADKGPDGIIIEFDDKTDARIVICEEKATESPRDRVRDQVWPEFRKFELGERDDELRSLIIPIFKEKIKNELKTVEKVNDLIKEKNRAYRVSVTTNDIQSTEEQRKLIFKDYENCVCGNVSKRRAETLQINDLRNSLERIANKALTIVNKWEKNQNVRH